MVATPLRQLGVGFAVRSASVRLLLEGDAFGAQLCAGISGMGQTLYFVEDAEHRWLLALEPTQTQAGLDRLGVPKQTVIAAIANDLVGDPRSRAYVAMQLRAAKDSLTVPE